MGTTAIPDPFFPLPLSNSLPYQIDRRNRPYRLPYLLRLSQSRPPVPSVSTFPFRSLPQTKPKPPSPPVNASRNERHHVSGPTHQRRDAVKQVPLPRHQLSHGQRRHRDLQAASRRQEIA